MVLWRRNLSSVGIIAVSILALGLALAPHGQAQDPCEKPGPDDHGYSCSETDFEWEPTFTDGVNLTIDDDGFVNRDLPFDFPFYESTYSEFNISDNGFVCFTNCTENGASYIEQTVPDDTGPNNLVACAWTDLDPRTADRVTYDEEGSRVVVHYANLTHIFSDAVYNLQLWLDEGGTARCMLDQIPDDGQDKTAGVENITGTDGVRYKSGSWGASEVGVLFARAPASPTLLSAEGGNQEIRLDWSHPDPGAVDHYAVECQVVDAGNGKDTGDCKTGDWTYLTEVPGGTTAHTQDGLGDDVEIEYRVQANNSAGSSDPSNVLGNVTLDEPSKPTNLAAALVDEELTVELSWEAPDFDGNSEIDRYRVVKDGTEIANATVDEFESSDAFAFSDGDVACGDQPSYEVEARNAKGWSKQPATASPTVDHVCPDAPQNLAATAGTDWVNATWDAPGDQEKVDEYVVAWKNASESEFTEHRTTQTFFNITGLESQQDYDVRVRSFNATGGSSNNATATASTFGPPGPPENVATVPNLESIEVLWKNGSSGGEAIDHYRIVRVNLSSDGSQELGTREADEVFQEVGGDRYYRFTDDGDDLTSCSSYDYKIFAVNKAGSGPEGTALLPQGSTPSEDSTVASPIDTDAPCPGEGLPTDVRPEPPQISVDGPIAGEGAVQLTINYSENQPQEAHEYDIDMRPVGQDTWEDARTVDAVQTRVDEDDRDGEIQVRVDGVLCTSSYEFQTRGRYGQADTSLEWGEWSEPTTGSVDHHPPGPPLNFSAKPVQDPRFGYQVELNWTDLEDETAEKLTGCYDGDFEYETHRMPADVTFDGEDESPWVRTANGTRDCDWLIRYQLRAYPAGETDGAKRGSFTAFDNTSMEGCPEQPANFTATRETAQPGTVTLSWACPESWGHENLGPGDPAFKLSSPDVTIPQDNRTHDRCPKDDPDKEPVVLSGQPTEAITYQISATNDASRTGPEATSTVGPVEVLERLDRTLDVTVEGYDKQDGNYEIALQWMCNTDAIDADGDGTPDPWTVESETTHDYRVYRNGQQIATSSHCGGGIQGSAGTDEAVQYWDNATTEPGATHEYSIQPVVNASGSQASGLSGLRSEIRTTTTWVQPEVPPEISEPVFSFSSDTFSVDLAWSANESARGGAPADKTTYELARTPPGLLLVDLDPSCSTSSGSEDCTAKDEPDADSKSPETKLRPCSTYEYSVRMVQPREGPTNTTTLTTPGPAGNYSGGLLLVNNTTDGGTVQPLGAQLDESGDDEIPTWDDSQLQVTISVNRSQYDENDGCLDPNEDEQYIVWRDTMDASPVRLGADGDPAIDGTADATLDDEPPCGTPIRYRVQPTFSELPNTTDRNFRTTPENASDWSEWFEFTCPPVGPPDIQYARAGPDAFQIRVCWAPPEDVNVDENQLTYTVSMTESDKVHRKTSTTHEGLNCFTDDRELTNIPRTYEVCTVNPSGQTACATTNPAYPADPGMTNLAPEVTAVPGNWYGEVHLEWEPVPKRDLADNQTWPSADVPAKAAPDPDRYDVYYDPDPDDQRSAVKIGEATPPSGAGYENATVYRQQLCLGTEMAFSATGQFHYRPQCTIPKEPAALDEEENATFYVRPVWFDGGSTDEQEVWTDQGDPTASDATHYGEAGSDKARPADTGTLAEIYVEGEESTILYLSGKNVDAAEPGTNVSEVHAHVNYTQWSDGQPEEGSPTTLLLTATSAEGVYVTYWANNQTAQIAICEREGPRGDDAEWMMDQRKGVNKCSTLTQQSLSEDESSSDCPEACRIVTGPVDALGGDRLGVDRISNDRLVLERIPATQPAPSSPGIASPGDRPGG